MRGVLLGSRAFWPGFQWRVLAHRRPKRHEPWATDSFDVRSGIERDAHATFRHFLDGDWEFDELVIDDWFHLEQMSERTWWMGVGKGDDYWHVNVTVDGKGEAVVNVEKQAA